MSGRIGGSGTKRFQSKKSSADERILKSISRSKMNSLKHKRTHPSSFASSFLAIFLTLLLLRCSKASSPSSWVIPQGVSARRLTGTQQNASDLLKAAQCYLTIGNGPGTQQFPAAKGRNGTLWSNLNTTTLHSLSAALDVNMDALLALNPSVDLSNPNNIKPGMRIAIPCPGTAYPRHIPLYIAGGFVMTVG